MFEHCHYVLNVKCSTMIVTHEVFLCARNIHKLLVLIVILLCIIWYYLKL